MKKLTARQHRFVEEYCTDPDNCTAAYIRAGYADTDSAGRAVHILMKSPHIKAAIKARMREVATTAGVTPEWVVARWVDIVNANPNSLVSVRRVNCRYCHGSGNLYQWDDDEYEDACDKASIHGKPMPRAKGGGGFLPNGAPNPLCPKCNGFGEPILHIGDTRNLSDADKSLYAGAEPMRGGIKIIMRDKDAALNNLARYLGILVDRKELSGPGGKAIEMSGRIIEELTDEQLAAIINERES